ncbi:hypothetical protein PPTG_22833 [Phytophthora nicotianae INRA-310]|uniref:Uncharacterized protein n=2 Tax=Phytophthora nicotianae TaxID=4792 RepID=W2QB91_PHYN3|nr:hypothetical protein PPTG_22833 [Phytophthora nicotianae INRA-310]ETN09804.1 hypothetical protein PPTG_22833 [Phytophthora nicotianae INRA-310]
MPKHLRDEDDQATKRTAICDYSKKTRSYNFSILNESVFEVILSFLSNQTLTKLHGITGDRYEQCEPELAGFCCQCENDNPAIAAGLCRKCIPMELLPHASRLKSREKYGLANAGTSNDKDFRFEERVAAANLKEEHPSKEDGKEKMIATRKSTS